jgi:Protein of unknown function (DUF2442)
MAPEWKPMTDEELQRQYVAGVEAGRIAEMTEPRATSVRYNRDSGRIELELRNGCFFAFPAEIVQGLQGASPEQIAAVEIWGDGYALRWDALDLDFTVPGLLQGRFGNRKWLAQWGGSGWNAPAPPPPAEEAQPEPVRRRKAS